MSSEGQGQGYSGWRSSENKSIFCLFVIVFMIYVLCGWCIFDWKTFLFVGSCEFLILYLARFQSSSVNVHIFFLGLNYQPRTKKGNVFSHVCPFADGNSGNPPPTPTKVMVGLLPIPFLGQDQVWDHPTLPPSQKDQTREWPEEGLLKETLDPPPTSAPLVQSSWCEVFLVISDGLDFWVINVSLFRGVIGMCYLVVCMQYFQR